MVRYLTIDSKQTKAKVNKTYLSFVFDETPQYESSVNGGICVFHALIIYHFLRHSDLSYDQIADKLNRFVSISLCELRGVRLRFCMTATHDIFRQDDGSGVTYFGS